MIAVQREIGDLESELAGGQVKMKGFLEELGI